MAEETKPNTDEKDDKKEEPEVPPIVTRHEMTLGDKTLHYTVTTGMLPIRNDKEETEAHIFFMAYALDTDTPKAERPLMFSFNGGPGSSSVWLHLGALGPKRVALLPDGNLPPPPYKLVDNEATWLEQTDLVFLDPVGTGYSRAKTPELGKKFWGLEGDIESVGEFIRLFLTRYGRWSSPLFLVGESYGTTRAAGLSEHLLDKGIAFNGILLVSSILNFQTAGFDQGNDLPYSLFLPTYTATAWYHNKLAPELQTGLINTLAEAEVWAATDYTLALAKGDALGESERTEIAAKLARYTGLSEKYVLQSNLRIHIWRFCKELLREEGWTVGRLDSRIKGRDTSAIADSPDFDPSMATIRPPYTAVFCDYVRGQLGYETDRPYHILGGGIDTPWDWGNKTGYPDTSASLRDAFSKNPHLKLFVASGYFDLATPYFATDYTLNHMGLASDLRPNITTATYESGHMMYIHHPSLGKLRHDVVAFLQAALG